MICFSNTFLFPPSAHFIALQSTFKSLPIMHLSAFSFLLTIFVICVAIDSPNDSDDLNLITANGPSLLGSELLADGTACSDSASPNLRVRRRQCDKYKPKLSTTNNNPGDIPEDGDSQNDPSSLDPSQFGSISGPFAKYYHQFTICYSNWIVCAREKSIGLLPDIETLIGEGIEVEDGDIC